MSVSLSPRSFIAAARNPTRPPYCGARNGAQLREVQVESVAFYRGFYPNRGAAVCTGVGILASPRGFEPLLRT